MFRYFVSAVERTRDSVSRTLGIKKKRLDDAIRWGQWPERIRKELRLDILPARISLDPRVVIFYRLSSSKRNARSARVRKKSTVLNHKMPRTGRTGRFLFSRLKSAELNDSIRPWEIATREFSIKKQQDPNLKGLPPPDESFANWSPLEYRIVHSILLLLSLFTFVSSNK